MSDPKTPVAPVMTNQIRRQRFEHGEMTQQSLAERVGVTRQTIIALEGGKYLPSLELAFRLASVFGVRVDDLFQLQPVQDIKDSEKA